MDKIVIKIKFKIFCNAHFVARCSQSPFKSLDHSEKAQGPLFKQVNKVLSFPNPNSVRYRSMFFCVVVTPQKKSLSGVVIFLQ